MIDKRLTENEVEMFKSLIGSIFENYQHDVFQFSTCVFHNVEFVVNGENYVLKNEIQRIPFFENDEDFAIFSFLKCDKEMMKSSLVGMKQTTTPIREAIKDILLVNDIINVKKNNAEFYELSYTKAVIFVFADRKICFAKTIWFDEHINIIVASDPLAKLDNPLNGFEANDDSFLVKGLRKVVSLVNI